MRNIVVTLLMASMPAAAAVVGMPVFTVAIIPSTAIPMEVATTRPTEPRYCSTGEID